MLHVYIGNNFISGIWPFICVGCFAYHVSGIECPLLPDLTNGVITYMEDMTPNFELTTMAIHECNEPGYTRVGPRIRTCVRSSDPNSPIGVWDQTAPTCVRKSGKIFFVYYVYYL